MVATPSLGIRYVAQCEKLTIFLLLRFYVKSILVGECDNIGTYRAFAYIQQDLKCPRGEEDQILRWRLVLNDQLIEGVVKRHCQKDFFWSEEKCFGRKYREENCGVLPPCVSNSYEPGYATSAVSKI